MTKRIRIEVECYINGFSDEYYQIDYWRDYYGVYACSTSRYEINWFKFDWKTSTWLYAEPDEIPVTSEDEGYERLVGGYHQLLIEIPEDEQEVVYA